MTKILITVLCSITLLSSCNRDADLNATNEDKSEVYPQKWQLISMSGNIANVPPSTGEDMSWQEFYILNGDQTFIKSRTTDGKTVEASGTYAFIEISEEKYLELTYSTDHEIIGNCTVEAKELLSIQSESRLFNTWTACDGPGLEYVKEDIE